MCAYVCKFLPINLSLTSLVADLQKSPIVFGSFSQVLLANDQALSREKALTRKRLESLGLQSEARDGVGGFFGGNTKKCEL